MKDLCELCLEFAYEVVVVRQNFDDNEWSCPEVFSKRDFGALGVLFRM